MLGTLAASLVLGLAALAAPAAVCAQERPPAAGQLVDLPMARLNPGEVWRYRVETKVEEATPQGAKTTNDVQVVDITVRSISGGRAVLSSTPVSIEGPPAFFVRTYVGRRLDFEANLGGQPLSIPVWEMMRAILADGFRRNGEGGDEAAVAMQGANEMQAIQAVLAEPTLIGSMQSWGPMTPRQTAAPRIIERPDGTARYLGTRQVLGVNARDRTIRVSRTSELDLGSAYAIAHKAVDTTKVEAVISAEDGWVLSLEEHHTLVDGDTVRVRDRKVTRLPRP